MIVDEIKAERARLVRGKVKNVLIIFLMLIIVGAPSFLYFKISTEEHIAFREAKNIPSFQILVMGIVSCKLLGTSNPSLSCLNNRFSVFILYLSF